jgi:hypothetical protein
MLDRCLCVGKIRAHMSAQTFSFGFFFFSFREGKQPMCLN